MLCHLNGRRMAEGKGHEAKGKGHLRLSVVRAITEMRRSIGPALPCGLFPLRCDISPLYSCLVGGGYRMLFI